MKEILKDTIISQTQFLVTKYRQSYRIYILYLVVRIALTFQLSLYR